MHERVIFLILLCVIGMLCTVIGFWRRKTADASFAAARAAATAKERDRYCRLAVLAGYREACLMFCFARSDFFEDHQPLKPFKSHGIKVAFYGYYYPSRYTDLIDDEQRAFCRSLYQFKEGENHGIEFFKACMSVLNLDDAPYHILFMPCSDEFKYARRFKRLDWYITTHRPDLSSGLYDVDVFESRDSLHEAKGGENRILERNYRITGYHGEYRRETDYHRGRRTDKRTEYGRLQGRDRKVRRQGGGGYLLWQNRYPAASASDKGARVGWLHREQNQGTDEMKE